jgi:hypothetical protein
MYYVCDLQRFRGLQTSVLVSENGVCGDFGKFAEILQLRHMLAQA